MGAVGRKPGEARGLGELEQSPPARRACVGRRRALGAEGLALGRSRRFSLERSMLPALAHTPAIDLRVLSATRSSLRLIRRKRTKQT